jgi:RsiW-degrading membrane proteinase PrsW (M82 family)
LYNRGSVICARCGHALGVAARFCGSCGQVVTPLATFGALGDSLSEVLLFDKFTMTEILRSPVFRFVFFLAMGPLALAHLDRISFILWGIALYSGVLWALLVYRLFAGRDLSFPWAIGTLFFTCFLMVPLLELYLSIPPDFTHWLITRELPLFQLAGYVFGVGVREELTKAVPLLLLAALTTRMRNPLTGLVLGFMSGIGFAVAENVLYVYKTVSHAATMQQASGALGELVVPVYNNVIRMAMGPFVHGCLAGIFGYFIALAVLNASRRVFLLLAGLWLAAFLHGLYDTVVAYSPVVGLLVHALTYLLLMTYVLKARGLASAHDIGGGVFNRTVMGRAPSGILAAAAAAATPHPGAFGLAPTSVGRPRAAREATPIPADGPQSWRLRGTAGAATGRLVTLEAETRIGRDGRRCDLHLDEPTVSREHALLVPADGGQGWRVRRLSRTSNLFVNDQPVEEVLLAPGDRLQLGGSAFVVEVAGG